MPGAGGDTRLPASPVAEGRGTCGSVRWLRRRGWVGAGRAARSGIGIRRPPPSLGSGLLLSENTERLRDPLVFFSSPFPLPRLQWRTAGKTESLPSRRAIARGRGGRNRSFPLGHAHFTAEDPKPLGYVTQLSPPTHMRMLRDPSIPKRRSRQVKAASCGTLSSPQENFLLCKPRVQMSVTWGTCHSSHPNNLRD